MVDVLITIDTEFWPSHSRGGRSDFAADVARDIEGRTHAGAYGLPFQLARMREHDLRAVFLVEALSALAVSRTILNDIVSQIRAADQEVQLHLHPEWLDWMPRPPLPGGGRQNMHQFALDDQTKLVNLGAGLLRSCGVAATAFRAGNYGADLNTLTALARNNIDFDTSYNAPYLETTCKIDAPSILIQPTEVNGLWEYPITHFRDIFGKRRHLQIVACSIDELRDAFWHARSQEWSAIVLVLHSFELIHRRSCRADRIVVDRFEWLCRFLAENRSDFRTTTFTALARAEPQVSQPSVNFSPFNGKMLPTGRRLVEQLLRRVTHPL